MVDLYYNYYSKLVITLKGLSNIEKGCTFDIKKLTHSDGFITYTLVGTYVSTVDSLATIQDTYYYNSVDKSLIIVLGDSDTIFLDSLLYSDSNSMSTQDTLCAAKGRNVLNGVETQAITNVHVTISE